MQGKVDRTSKMSQLLCLLQEVRKKGRNLLKNNGIVYSVDGANA